MGKFRVSLLSTLVVFFLAIGSSSWAGFVHSMQDGSIASFFMSSPARIERYDLSNRQWLSAISLPSTHGVPTAGWVDADGIYVAYGISAYRYDQNGNNEVHLTDVAQNINQILSDGNILFLNRSGSLYARFTSIDKNTNTVIANFQNYIDAVVGASIAPSINKMFGRSSGISPSDITYVNYSANGTFGSGGDSPYHGDYPSATKTWVFPDDGKVVDSSGTVYSTSGLTYLNSFGSNVTDVEFFGGEIPIVLNGNKLTAYTITILPTGSTMLDHSPNKIFISDQTVLTFTMSSSDPRGLVAGSIPLSSLNPPTPGDPIDPTGLAYSPDDSFVGKDGILYLFSKTHQSIFRWDSQLERYVTTIPLVGTPKYVEYSPDNHTIYTAYSSGLIREINLDDPGLEEKPFVNLPSQPYGLSTAGPYVFAADPSGAWSSHYTFGPDGTSIDTVDWNHATGEYIWSDANQKMYFFSQHSPRDLMWEQINADGVTYPSEPPGGIGADKDSPLHSSLGFTYPIRVAPDGSIVVLGSGVIHDATTLARLTKALANSIADIAWIGNDIYTARTVNGATQYQQWLFPTFEAGTTTNYPGTANRLTNLDGTTLIGISINDSGVPSFQIMDSDFEIVDKLIVSLPVSASEADGILVAAGMVSVPTAPASNLVVNLVSEDPSEVLTANSVVILAGETNATFDILVQDDADLDGSQAAMIAATTKDHHSRPAKMIVHDNEVASLSITLPPSTIEGAGSVSGSVTIDAVPVADIVVTVVSDDPSEVLSSKVVVPAGATSAPFSLDVVDDNMIDGSQSVGITAVVQNWSNGVSSISVNDNETTDLALELPATVSEGDGMLANAATVRISGTLTTDLLITLQSDNPTELTVPSSVTIPAGSTSASFDLTAVNDAVLDGNQNAQIFASATGFTSATGAVTVADNEGEIRGSKWWDEDGDGVWGTNEIGLENWKIYQDLNSSGQWDSSEPFDLTDVDGSYSMIVEPGDYIIGEESQPNWVQTMPGMTGFEEIGKLIFEQVLKDEVDGVDGLDGASSVKLSSDGNYVYIAGKYDDAITILSRNPVTGELTYVQKLQDGVNGVDGLDGAYSIVISPDGNYVYITGAYDDSVAVFSRDQTTGQLDYVHMVRDGMDGVDGLNWARGLTLSPDGNHVYATGYFDSSVAVFSRDMASGRLSFVEMIKDGVGGVDGLYGASSVTVSPDGFHAYVAGYDDHAVAVFSRNPVSGQLTYVQVIREEVGENFDLLGVTSVTVSSDGNFVYITWSLGVSVFSRDPASGRLTFMQTVKDGVGGVDGLFGAGDAVISPSGSNLYVVGRFDDAVVVFNRDPVSGRLTYVQMFMDGDGAIDGLNRCSFLTISSGGENVYVTGQDDDAVTVFRCNTGPVPGTHSVVVNSQQVVTNIDFGNTTIGMVLNVVLPEGSSEGDGVVAGEVTLNVAPLSDLVVNLSADDASEVVVTNRLIIPAGQTNVALTVQILDDQLLDGSKPVTIDAYAIGYTRDSHVLTVHDNESASLTLSLPQITSESAGSVSGALLVDAVPDRDVEVSLISNNPSEIRGTNVTIRAGEIITVFDLAVEDDDVLDGIQTATITAHVHNWNDGVSSIFVVDDENTKLTVQVPDMATEGDGVLTNSGVVSIAGAVATDVHIALTSSDASEACVPFAVTIPGGQMSATFDLNIIDDLDMDGLQSVTITAISPGYMTGMGSMNIRDNEDLDSDLLPDWWENLYFGTLANCDPLVDGDGDGQINRDEFIAGMDPTDPESCFMVRSLDTPTNGAYVISWDSVTGRVYSVYWKTNMPSSFQMLGTGIHYPQNSYTDSVHSAEDCGFYTIDVELDLK